MADGTGSRTFNYDGTSPWRLNSEVLDPGFYASRVISRNYDSVSGTGGVYGPYTPGTFKGRYIGYDLGIAGNTTRDQHIAYTTSNLGRFVGVDTRTATGTARDYIYNYFSSSSLLGGYTMGSLSVIRGYEAQRNLLTSINSQWSGASYTRYDYTSNALGQRVTAKQSGSAFADYGQGLAYSGTYNVYNYNARGELQTTARYRGDNPTTAPAATDELPAMRFEYRYDSIGNRTTAGATGTTGDDNYTANALNQYTAKDNKTVKVLGTAGVGVNVAVAGAPATGKVDHAWGANLVPANSAGPVMAAATVNAAVPGGGTGGQDLLRTDSSRSYFVPQLSQALTYDADGNLTGDGVWTYTYNAENRLVRMNTLLNAGFTGMDVRIDFKYDYQGRRVEKSIFDYNLNTQTLDQRYVYDANNLIAQTDASGNLQRTFAWGLDLTGSLTAAGGVGALLEIGDLAAGKTLSVTYDGNGNVAGLVNVVSGALEAAYEYDPSGNLLRLEGTYAKSNPVRFSTKWQDDETGLVYYGLRYYSPTLGRFINRDSIGEQGGLNLYGFCRNNGINSWDFLGMDEDDPFVFAIPGITSPFIPPTTTTTSDGGFTFNFNPSGGNFPTIPNLNWTAPTIPLTSGSIGGKPVYGPSGSRLDPNAFLNPAGQWVSARYTLVNNNWVNTWYAFNSKTGFWAPYTPPPPAGPSGSNSTPSSPNATPSAPLNVADFRQNIVNVLSDMDNATGGHYGFNYDAAVNQLLGTALTESNLTRRVQLGGGPARGLLQMEEATYNSIWNTINTDSRYHDIANALANYTPAGGSLGFGLIENDDDYAIAMARLKYYFAPGTASIPTSISGQAANWRNIYNGNSPNGRTAQDYINIWNQSTGGAYDPAPPPPPSPPSQNIPAGTGGRGRGQINLN